jgi:hypothetical protein
VVCFKSETHAIFSHGEFIAVKKGKEDSLLVAHLAHLDLRELCFANDPY